MASVGLWLAFFMSLRFMTPGHTQTPNAGQAQKIEPPSPGDLPPEFIQETQGSSVGDNKIPPPPSQPPIQPPAHAEAGSSAGAPSMVSPTMPAGGDPQAPTQLQTEVVEPVVPQFATDDQYTYDPTGRRDPFKPFRTYRPVVTTGVARVTDSTDPLQRWDLDRFAVVAIMWEIRLPKAMVRDPEGKVYMISKNTKIGRNSGQVVTIREGEVVVVENIDNEGVQTKEVKILELKK
jgi:type IV pilus assembly protein PilP